MAVSVDWPTRVITVPRADMILVQSTPVEVRELDINTFRLELKALEDNADGMVYPDTHRHIEPITFGTTSLARVVEIINNYTITFEDGQYAVNITGGNTNLGDRVNVNQVSVRTSNSVGLVSQEELVLLLSEVHKRLGLNADDPFIDTPTLFSSQSGDIQIDVTGDCETITTQTRRK